MKFEKAREVMSVMNKINKLQEVVDRLNKRTIAECDIYNHGMKVCTLEKDEVETIINIYSDKIKRLEEKLESL